MEKRLATFIACLFLSLGMALAQIQVTGVVTSAEDGQPIVGASIKIVGTHTGTVTDIEGNFSLNVQAGAKLEISYIGMIGKTVKATKNMKIVLEPDNHSLEEVLVVAFGTAKKSAFTGSAAVVGSEQLSKKIATNVTDALVGSVPGLQLRGASGQPGSENNGINIRGIASMYAKTDPLVIVDGAPYPGNLSSIPTDDIESVTVLKDAASAALYGARGAAGVIMITTKNGKNKEAEVSIDMKWGANSRAVPQYDVIKDPGQYYEAFYAKLYNKNLYGANMSAEEANLKANKDMLQQLGYNVFSIPQNEQLIGLDGKLNPHATLGRTYEWNGEKYYMTADDWNKAAYKTALRQDYTISIKGSTDRSSFYTSLGYLSDDGVIDNSSYERVSARLKADYQAKKWLKVGINAQYVHSDTKSNPNLATDGNSTNLMYFVSQIAPIYPIYVRTVDANGNVMIKKDAYGHEMYDYGNPKYYGVGRGFSQTGNPLGNNRYNKVESGLNQINGSAFADVKFTDWLKFNATSTIIYSMTDFSDYENAYEGPKQGVNGELTKKNTADIRTNNTQTLTFMKSFGKHSMDVLLGHEYYKLTRKYLYAQGEGGFSPSITELNAFAYKKDNGSYKLNYNVEGFFGRAQYNYDDKYFASASYRRDASSRFAKDNRWGNFWSIGGAWLINKEAWFEAPFVDELKVKASLGQQGNDNIGDWAYTDLYKLAKASNTLISPSFYRVGNKDITWETTTNLNLGVEFSLFKHRLSGSFDFYTKKVADLLFWLSIPESQGSRGYYTNIGDMRNTGIEMVLTGVLVSTKDIDWSVTVNMSHNATKVLKLPAQKIEQYGGFNASNDSKTFGYWYREGGPMYNAYLPSYAGVNENGEALYWVDEKIDGNATTTGVQPGKSKDKTTTSYTKASYYEQGSLLPKIFGGLSTSFRYKSFDVSATFDFQLGGKVYDYHYSGLMDPHEGATSDNGKAIHKDYIKSWSPTNKSSNIPRWQFGDKFTAAKSDRFLISARYFNFQSFTVGYTLPKGIIPMISNIRVYCAGENLCFWSARKGLDPRYSYEGSAFTSTYSPTRNITGGIQVTF